MAEEHTQDEPDFAERAADATEQTRRERGGEGATQETEPDSGGRLTEGPLTEDEPDTRL